MPTNVLYSDTLVAIECGMCHIPFALPTSMHNSRKRDGKLFWCPNGHEICYSDSENQKLKDQLAREKANLKRTLARETAVRDQLQATEYHLRAEKGAKTKLKNRIAAGMCPCCRRTFQNVARHIEGQHPGFAAEHAGKESPK